MVPVLDSNRIPLMPCSEKRARQLMDKKQAKAFWQKGIFCIILTREPVTRIYQDIVVGIDPGSKREGYTVTTNTKVVLNLLTDTPSWVKDKMETRRTLRRSRRARKTPYRKCRFNRKIGGLPPSTRARWGAKLRIVKALQKLIPITDANVEDIKAVSKKGKRRWNVSFSPLEVGKNWFYSELEALDLNVFKTQGYETAEWRNARNFKKTSAKLKDVWEAHCVDSHVLCEKTVGGEIEPFKGMYRISFLNFARRQLHVQNPIKEGFRKKQGSTRSLGLNRGTLVVDKKFGISYVGGSSKGKLSLHSVESGKRLTQKVKKEDLTILSLIKWRTSFLPGLKIRVSRVGIR